MTDIVERLRACSKCNVQKHSDEFYRDSKGPHGRRNVCKSCVLERQAAYRKANKEKIRESDAKYRKNRDPEKVRATNGAWRKKNRGKLRKTLQQWRKNNPEKNLAHNRVRTLVRNGTLKRPGTCSDCGASGVRIEASHDDYEKPDVVEWLCVRCHRLKDGNPFMFQGALADKEQP
jgi:hypothetical protein